MAVVYYDSEIQHELIGKPDKSLTVTTLRSYALAHEPAALVSLERFANVAAMYKGSYKKIRLILVVPLGDAGVAIEAGVHTNSKVVLLNSDEKAVEVVPAKITQVEVALLRLRYKVGDSFDQVVRLLAAQIPLRT